MPTLRKPIAIKAAVKFDNVGDFSETVFYLTPSQRY
jgi:hypothetical protein